MTPEESHIYRKESIKRLSTPEWVAYNDQQSAILYATHAGVGLIFRNQIL